MKKLTGALLCIAVSSFSFGQFTDNFDSYTNGDYLAQTSANWTTWSGNTGGNEDVQVTNVKSKSGSNSIYFTSTAANGGPQDVVLPFGGVYNTGDFTFQQSMFVESTKGAYFNFQADATLGVTWALNAQFVQDGNLYISNGSNVAVLQTTYSSNTWFDLKIVANLNTNDWELFINNVSKGTFQNLDNQVASLDLFPVNGATLGGNNLSAFYVDDCGYSHTPYALPVLNAGVSRIDMQNPIINGLTNEPTIQVRNLSTTTITSFKVTVVYNGNTETKTVTGVSIDSLETYDVKLGGAFTISSSATSITATVSDVNGNTTDGDASDDTKTINFEALEPAPGKIVVVEEATGTWCGWCPRGQVNMEFLNRDYHGVAQGIAVHNGDPMVNERYDDGIGTMISGYPSALVDRGPDTDPSGIWDQVNERLQIPGHANMEVGAEFDGASRLLKVSLKLDFTQATTGDWRIACVLTEDSVTGTTSQYNQSNYYSNSQDLIDIYGNNWRNKPNPVPASQMVYNHVARMITPAFDGAPGSLPTSIAMNDQHIFNFEYTLPTDWDEDMIHIIGLLVDNTKSFDNGGRATIAEAIANGYEDGTDIVGVQELSAPDDIVQIYPNPTGMGYANVLVNVSDGDEVRIDLLDQGGRLLSSNYERTASGVIQSTISTEGLSEGIYVLKVNVGDRVEIRKLVVKN